MKQAASAVLIAVVAVLLHLSPRSVDAQPELTEVVPEDGTVLAGPPTVVRLCFSERLLYEEPGDFQFAMLTPEGMRLGLRIVFKPLTNCVDIHLGLPESPSFGQWTLEWEVTAEASGEVASNTVRYQVEEGGSPVPTPPPPASGTPRRGGTGTPADATPTSETADGDDDDLGAVWLAAIAAGSALVASAVAAALFLLRRRARLGQRPPPSA